MSRSQSVGLDLMGGQEGVDWRDFDVWRYEDPSVIVRRGLDRRLDKRLGIGGFT